MHVVILDRAASPGGGTERYLAETADGLRRLGARVTLLYDPCAPFDPGYAQRFDGAFPLADARAQVALLRPDVVYAHRLPAHTDEGELAKLGAPVVRFFHDHASFCPREHKYTVLGRRTCSRTVGAGCLACMGGLVRTERFPGVRLRTPSDLRRQHVLQRRSAAIVVGSAYMARHVVAHGFPESRVRVLPLFTSSPTVVPTSPREQRRVLFVGALTAGKGVDVWLRALARLPEDVVCDIVGDGPQRPGFEGLAAELGVADRVSFIGRLGGAALAQRYAQAGCVVVPSRSPETFALVGLEALVQETPVVASDAGGVREWLRPRENGLAVPPGDEDALALAVSELLGDPARCRSMGRAGRALVEQRFRPGLHLSGLREVLAHAASRVAA